jgi:DNA polymerase-3 subunit epsilon
VKTKYFYNVDCYCLNKIAYFYYPLQRRLADYMHRFLPSGSTVKLESNSDRVGSRTVKIIVDKIHAVLTDTNWEQKLSEASYVIFDTETTGLQPFRGDRITSLAAVIVEKGVIQDRSFNVLVNPQRPISAASSRITGITDGMVSDKPTLHEVLPDFLDFIGNKTLVAHCAAFDLAFLNAELCRIAPVRILNPVIDTYLVANIMLPEMKSCSLENLVNRLGLQMKGRHTALGDSLMTAEIFLYLLEELFARQIYTLDQLQRFLISQKNSCFSRARFEHIKLY